MHNVSRNQEGSVVWLAQCQILLLFPLSSLAPGGAHLGKSAGTRTLWRSSSVPSPLTLVAHLGQDKHKFCREWAAPDGNGEEEEEALP